MSALSMRDLILHRRVIVCAGSGGVGKTTASTAIALAAAREGRKVLALTVDPSKRLAQTLGVDRNNETPVPIPESHRLEAGIEPGLLEAWMLDPSVVADRFVERFAETPEEAERLINNRLYRQISRMVAGMQEYMAMEALYGFLREERYDLVVLDTPPSRNALDFLYGPSRLSSFLDGRIFKLFLPEDGTKRSFIRRAASRLVNGVNAAVFGAEYYAELQDFFSSFSGIFRSMNKNAAEGMARLRDPERVAFLLVTSPASTSLTDAFFFRRKTVELELPFRGFILNRSQATKTDRTFPDASLFGGDPDPIQRSALTKLIALAEVERAAVERDQQLLARLREDADGGLAIALPNLPTGADAMPALVHLGEVLLRA